jgi:hypothetical protein
VAKLTLFSKSENLIQDLLFRSRQADSHVGLWHLLRFDSAYAIGFFELKQYLAQSPMAGSEEMRAAQALEDQPVGSYEA